ncbi:MAG TPA: hypothetical protein VM694_10595, partial [Polyangium sp.]|nr:hypothetical protein [Polyangium sp.]
MKFVNQNRALFAVVMGLLVVSAAACDEGSTSNGEGGSSAYGANTKGSGFTEWGAGFGFDLNNDGLTKKAFNGSQFAGIQFWAKIGSGTGAVRFNVGDS